MEKHCDKLNNDFIYVRKCRYRPLYLLCAYLCQELIKRPDHAKNPKVSTFTQLEVDNCLRKASFYKEILMDKNDMKFIVLALRRQYQKETNMEKWTPYVREA